MNDDRKDYLKEKQREFLKSKDKAWELWTKVTDTSIHLNTSTFDSIPDVEMLREKLWDLREILEMVDKIEVKKEYNNE